MISNTTTTTTANSTSTVGWSTTNLPKNLIGSATGSVAIAGGSISTVSSGTVLMGSVGAVSGSSWGSISVNSDMTDFCEMVLSALGHDITYDDFCKMSKKERKSLLRDIKIKRLLD